MKRLIFALVVVASMLTSCATDNNMTSATISGRFVGSGADTIFLDRISDNFTSPERIAASPLADNGAFSFTVAIEEGASPRFYKLSAKNMSRPVMLIVAPEDNITLESAGDIFLNYEVEGSEESALIRQFNRDYFSACDRLAFIADDLGATRSYNEQDAYRAAQEAIHAQLRFVGTYQNKLAAFYAMRHTVAEQYIPMLEGLGITLAHYRAVLEGIRVSYPDSPYIAIIEHEIEQTEAFVELAQNVEYVSYPEIELEDMYKQKHKLSSLEGQVVLLYFWSAESVLCNNLNADLKDIYERYHDDGFEIYHVSADADIPMWIEVVRQQGLPWISVSGGNNAEVFTLYNVTSLPTAYLIDREGTMKLVESDIDKLERDIRALL